MRLAIFVAAVFAIVAPALAQDGSETAAQRTPESAQRFLSEFYAQGGLKATQWKVVQDGGFVPYMAGASLPNDASGKARWTVLFGQVAAWTATGRCKTRIDLANARSSYADQVSSDFPPQSVTADLDWGRVVAVHIGSAASMVPVRLADGSYGQMSYFSVYPQGRNGEPMSPSLLFDTKQEADRVGFALDFLHSECALGSDTGF